MTRRLDLHGGTSWRILAPTIAVLTLGGFVTSCSGANEEEETVGPEVAVQPPDVPPEPEAPLEARDLDITVTTGNTFQEAPITELPPPPVQGIIDIASRPMYTPRTVEPSVRNLNEVVAALQRSYPPLLRQAGIEGTAMLYILVSEGGEPEQVRIGRSSGYPQFDDAAAGVGGQIQFTPAEYRGDPVRVWAQIPVSYTIDR